MTLPCIIGQLPLGSFANGEINLSELGRVDFKSCSGNLLFGSTFIPIFHCPKQVEKGAQFALHHLPNSNRIHCKSWNKTSWTSAGLTSNPLQAICPLAAYSECSPPKQVKIAATAQRLLYIICQNCNRIHCKCWSKPSWTGQGWLQTIIRWFAHWQHLHSECSVPKTSKKWCSSTILPCIICQIATRCTAKLK